MEFKVENGMIYVGSTLGGRFYENSTNTNIKKIQGEIGKDEREMKNIGIQ